MHFEGMDSWTMPKERDQFSAVSAALFRLSANVQLSFFSSSDASATLSDGG